MIKLKVLFGVLVIAVFVLVVGCNAQVKKGNDLLPKWAQSFDDSRASIEAIKEYINSSDSHGLTAVDNFKKHSDTKYRYVSIDYAFREKFYPANGQDGMEREDGAVKLKSNGKWYVKNHSLKPGESVMLMVIPSVGAYTGMVIGNTRLDFGNYSTKRDAMPLLFRTGPTEWEMKDIIVIKRGEKYLRMVIGDNNPFPHGPLPYLGKPITLIATRGVNENKNKITWQVTGPYAEGQGSYIDDELQKEASFGLVSSGLTSGPDAVVLDFKHGKLDETLTELPTLRLAPWVPELLSERQTWDQHNLRMVRAREIIKDIKPTGIVSQKEIEMFKDYYKACGLPHSNMQNGNTFSFDNWNACLDFYRISGDIWFLNHATKIAERILLVGTKSEGVLQATIDNFGKTTCERFVKMPGHYPHFRRCFYNENGDLVNQCDVAQLSLLKPSAAFCKLVSEDKTLWNKTIPDGDPNKLGATYKERAISYLNKLHQRFEYMTPYRLEPKTYLFRYPNADSSIMAYNRWYLSIISLPEAAGAMEAFGVYPDRVKFYDDMVQSGIDYLRKFVVPIEHKEGLIWTWPYRIGRPAPPAEDVFHGCATLNCIRRFYESGRYDITRDEMLSLIRPYRYLCYDPKTETFSFRTDAYPSKKGRSKTYNLLAKLIVMGRYFPIFDEWTLEPVMRNNPEIRSILYVIQRRAERWGVE